jgi:hypothetical protein
VLILRTLGVSKDAQSAVPVALSLYHIGGATRSHSFANSIIQQQPAATAKRYSAMSTAARARTEGVELSQ